MNAPRLARPRNPYFGHPAPYTVETERKLQLARSGRCGGGVLLLLAAGRVLVVPMRMTFTQQPLGHSLVPLQVEH